MKNKEGRSMKREEKASSKFLQASHLGKGEQS